jgi:hypothetical protein
MCLAMYLFSDNDINETQYNCNNPSMFIKKINSDYNEYKNILKWCENKKYIYYIGSSEGCGCGWRYTYSYTESYDNEIKHYSKEIDCIKNKIIEINYENICYELIENNIRYLENEIPGIMNSRKEHWKNQIENCENSIKQLKTYKNDRNDLYKFLKSMDFNESFIVLCWEGDQGKEIEKITELNMEMLKNMDYVFNELVKYILYIT